MKLNRETVIGVIRKFLYAAVAWPLVTLCLGVVTGFDAFPFIAATIIVVALDALRHQYLRSLEARVAATRGMIWRVNLNDVVAGEISDRDYARLQLEVFNDPRIYGRQVMNLGRVAVHAFAQIIRTVPIVAFWVGLGAYLYLPNEFADARQSIMSMTHDQVVAASGTLLRIAIMSVLIASAFQWQSGNYACGFVNHFRDEINRRLRIHCKAAAEGNINLLGRLPGAFENEVVATAEER